MLLLAGREGDAFCFLKTYVHHNRRDEVSFTADHGYAHHCLTKSRALIITKTYDDARPPYGEGFDYDLDNLDPHTARPVRIPYKLAPKTIEDERSLLLFPIYGIDEHVPLGVLKLGDLERCNAFDASHLRAAALFARELAAILYAITVGETLTTLKATQVSQADMLKHAETLFFYREIALGLFHQVGHCAHQLGANLLSVEAELSGTLAQSDDLRQLLDSSRSEIRTAKELITKAQKRGHALKPLASECLLIRDVIQPAIDHINKPRAGATWRVEHALGSYDYPVYLDSELTRESLINVLSNSMWAVKRNTRNTRKEVFVALKKIEDASRVRIEVQDTGIGIARDDQSRVFEPFFTTRGESGTGLGLYFARRLLQEFGGTIEIARSQTEKGTTMVITLPVLRKRHR